MQRLQSLIAASVGCAIVIGATSLTLAKEPKPMRTPMPPMSSPTAPVASPSPAASPNVPTVKLSATLAPQSEVPPTSVKGTGTATVNVYSSENKVCYRVTVSGLESITGAHIHLGQAGKAGPVVVPFTTPTKGTSFGCVTVKPELLQAIASKPSNYYVNVHTQKYANGALRGQLAVTSSDMK